MFFCSAPHFFVLLLSWTFARYKDPLFFPACAFFWKRLWLGRAFFTLPPQDCRRSKKGPGFEFQKCHFWFNSNKPTGYERMSLRQLLFFTTERHPIFDRDLGLFWQLYTKSSFQIPRSKMACRSVSTFLSYKVLLSIFSFKKSAH